METIDALRAQNQSWPRCPEAAEYFASLFHAFSSYNPTIAAMADRMIDHAGVRLQDLVDHWTVRPTYSLDAELTAIGLTPARTIDGDEVWEHPSARLPRIRVADGADAARMTIAVEDLRHFADCNDLPVSGQRGDPGSQYEEVIYPLDQGEFGVAVRRGYRGFRPGRISASDERRVARAREAFRSRPRLSGTMAAEETARLFASLSGEVEPDRLVDEFFAIEREYYMARNRAARRQYDQQQAVGIGWANHDHHTYRSSRAGFRSLINLWLEMGFEAREKFYAGAEAGWGAQILEHAASRVVLFCDVDMAPDEINIDYAVTDLPPLPHLGTIGLWCGIHSESIASAGLHHLEAEFDFTRVRNQFVKSGFEVMAPFTDLPMLKQAFTAAERWQVDPSAVQSLHDLGLISAEERDRFVAEGAPGSHLEILQRWEGFKGFNKTGIDAIIRDTDARK